MPVVAELSFGGNIDLVYIRDFSLGDAAVTVDLPPLHVFEITIQRARNTITELENRFGHLASRPGDDLGTMSCRERL